MAFKDNLTAILAGAGVTQTELARRLGIQPAAVNQWCSGKTEPKAGLLLEIADALDVLPAALLARDGDRPGPEFAQDIQELTWLNLWRDMPADTRSAVLTSLRNTIPHRSKGVA